MQGNGPQVPSGRGFHSNRWRESTSNHTWRTPAIDSLRSVRGASKLCREPALGAIWRGPVRAVRVAAGPGRANGPRGAAAGTVAARMALRHSTLEECPWLGMPQTQARPARHGSPTNMAQGIDSQGLDRRVEEMTGRCRALSTDNRSACRTARPLSCSPAPVEPLLERTIENTGRVWSILYVPNHDQALLGTSLLCWARQCPDLGNREVQRSAARSRNTMRI